MSKHLNRVLEVNPEERWARIQPGVVLDELNAQLRPHGLWFAPDLSPSNRATLGGMMGNNASGARSIVYGRTVEHVLEMQAVLPDGEVIGARPVSAGGADAAAGDPRRERERSTERSTGWSPPTEKRSSRDTPRSCAERVGTPWTSS